MTSEFAVAVHALVFLNHQNTSKSSEEIAENVCTHPVRIRKVLAKLKKAGLVDTKEGTHGGYHFIKKPENVNLLMVCKCISEKPVDVKMSTGDMDMDCQIASGMAGIMEAVYSEMDEACYDVLKRITIASIDKKLFM